MNKRLLAYGCVSIAVAMAFGIAYHGIFPYEANVSEAVDACNSGEFDGVASPLGPGQMRAEDCLTLGSLYTVSASAWLTSSVATLAAVAFMFMYIIRVLNAKKPGV